MPLAIRVTLDVTLSEEAAQKLRELGEEPLRWRPWPPGSARVLCELQEGGLIQASSWGWDVLRLSPLGRATLAGFP